MTTEIAPSNEETISESIIPTMDSHAKTRYLAYRACGFSVREAAQLVPISESAIRGWRYIDSKFAEVESNIKEYRDELSKEHINLEFTRNYALVLQKDFNVIQKSIHSPSSLTNQENAYLLKARAHYSPQQLAILQQLLGKAPEEMSFTDVVLRLSRTREEIEIEGKSR